MPVDTRQSRKCQSNLPMLLLIVTKSRGLSTFCNMAPIPWNDEDFTMEVRDTAPLHYLLKIESFSKLSENGIEMYESNEFDACSYKWKMIIYPNGDENIGGNDYISIHLAIVDISSLPACWEATVIFSFFLFNHFCDNYLVICGQEQRFHKIKWQWGCSKFISHKSLEEPTNGYLVDDNCILGAEILVIKNEGIGECLSFSKCIKSYRHEWKIFEFSKLEETCVSEEFTVGDYKWNIELHPTGTVGQNGKNLCIFLHCVDAEGFNCRKRVRAEYSISVKNQYGEQIGTCGVDWFSAKETGWGWESFMPLPQLKDPKKSFPVNDCCIVEALVSVVGVVDELS